MNTFPECLEAKTGILLTWKILILPEIPNIYLWPPAWSNIACSKSGFLSLLLSKVLQKTKQFSRSLFSNNMFSLGRLLRYVKGGVTLKMDQEILLYNNTAGAYLFLPQGPPAQQS